MRSGSLLAIASALLVGLAPSVSAALDVNQATLAQLESIRGIGPDLAEAILAERARAPFADWTELARRVRGIGTASAARLSANGLTVNGQPHPDAAASRRTPAPPRAAP